MPTATPTGKRNTNHLTLTDGTTTLGLTLCDRTGRVNELGIQQFSNPRTVMRIAQGTSGGYGDLELPYSTMVQEDWSAGIGQEDLADATRYLEGYRIDTTNPGDVIPGPSATTTTSYDIVKSGSTEHTVYELSEWASSFTTTAAFDLRNVIFSYIYAGNLPEDKCVIDVKLYSDSSGPNTLLASGTSDYGNFSPNTTSILIYYSLEASKKYWISFTLRTVIGLGTTTDNKFYKGSSTGISLYTGGPGSWTLSASNTTLAYYLNGRGKGNAIFFEMKNALYTVNRGDDDTAPNLWMNGYRGPTRLANTNQRNQMFTSLNLANVNLAGKIVKIVSGPGKGEATNWRTIVSNTQSGTNDTITVTPEWQTTHSTSTNFVILGCDTWQKITGHGMTKPITDVCVVDDVVYFAMGDATNIRRGAWTTTGFTWKDDNSNKADFLKLWYNDAGTRKVVRATAATSIVDFSSVTDPLSFGSSVTCGSNNSNITNLALYDNLVWVMKEDQFGSINNAQTVYAPVPLGEMATVKDESNGRAWCQNGVYLYLSMGKGLERYYDQKLDDMGPNRDEGMSASRTIGGNTGTCKGTVVHIISYPGRLYAAIDAGVTGYSSIMCYNGTGWHQIYQGAYGKRIRRLHIQVLPGDTVDRLWISEEEDIYWIPLASNARKATGYTYFSGGYVIGSWKYGNFRDITKYWDSVKLFTENLDTTHQYITMEFQTDTSTSWTAMPSAETFHHSPGQEMDLSATNNVTGLRWREKITLYTDDPTKYPRLKAELINCVVRIPPKNSYTLTFLIEDNPLDLQGNRSTTSADTQLDKLMEWADSRTRAHPIYAEQEYAPWSGKYVFIEPPSVAPIEIQDTLDPRGATETRRAKYIATMVIWEK